MGTLDGKVALVTGGARGQGRSHALTFAREGADVVICDLLEDVDSTPYPLATPADLESTRKEIEALDRRVLAERVDVREQSQIDALVEQTIAELGGLDIVVANAGIWSRAPLWELTEEAWGDMLDINLTGVWRTTKAVAPHLIERGEGSIVMISSANGLEGGPNYAHYVAAKHGVVGLMRAAALELGPHGIRCNAICPGVIDTPQNDWQGAYDMMAGHPGGTPEDRRLGAAHWSILKGRGLLPAAAVSNAILFLVSDAGRDLTGLALPVDGGHMVLPGINNEPVR
jgi:SDR family mycofactocin-dependent oxidoreductase